MPQPAPRIPPQPVLENQHLQELSLPPKAYFKVFISLKCLIVITLNFKTRGHLNWKIDCFFFFSFENVKTPHSDKFRTHSKFFSDSIN